MLCENASRNGYGSVITPQCYDGQAEKRVTVTYNEIEKDTFLLCAGCAKRLAKDARRHGYTVTSRKV